MGVADVQFDADDGAIVDLSSSGMQKLEPNFICSTDARTLILDGNQIMKLDHLERSPGLQQLSVASNRLVRMMGVSRLTELTVLNLPNNSIGYVEGLRDLSRLEWLNLSGNNIKVMEQLHNCVSLKHLDLSDNNVSAIGDLTKLLALKTLLLHGNSITTLRTVPAHLPANLSILSLAENEIRDLNEVSYLAHLHNMDQLSIMSNPCVMATPSLPGFDYRPYTMSWCLSLKVLDGYVVSQKEGLKAEWLYSQGKGRSYRPGQHVELVQYLATVCPLTSSPALETAEDAKLEKILRKQRFHQRQLLEETRGGPPPLPPPPPRPTQLDVETHSPSSHAVQRGGSKDARETSGPALAAAPSAHETEPVMRLNNWVSCDSSQRPTVYEPRLGQERVYSEDVQTDEDKLDSSALPSDSAFLPVASHLDPCAARSDSEDETETFEPDSLAPKRPAQPEKHDTDEQEGGPEEDVLADESLDFRHGASQKDLKASSDFGEARVKDVPRREEARTNASKPSLTEAAVKIQARWRGRRTRCCHPMAREVRGEIRLRRMQEHILFLSERSDRMQRQYEEEHLQRLVQEEAVTFLWTELQSLQQWKRSVEQQLVSLSQPAPPARISPPGLHEAFPPAASGADVSFPDSGFQSTNDPPAAQEDSFLSSGTADSPKTVRALSPAGEDEDGADCSLLKQYLSSVQQREEEEEINDRTATPQPSSPPPKADSPPPMAGDDQSNARSAEEAV
ncbi:centrosomal protein of 97 kDa [Brachionichthys hirsutus]|uniref:centrosomal protein of 97 kDa n=1 Tax=Brachionichthys hirsutus TaxID=412623 RepID=UPI0036045473